jgi:hypothetical protein
MLDDAALTSAVFAHLGTQQPSTAAAAAAFATVYDTYCQGATFGASVPTLTGRKATFEGVLAAGLAAGMPTVCTAMGNAVAAYWLAVPVVGAQSGTVPTCPGASAIGPALVSLVAAPNSRAVAAAALAGALATATRTCVANVSPPPGTVLPIA